MMIDVLIMVNLFLLGVLLLTLMFKFMLMVLMVMEILVVSISIFIFMVFSMINMEVFMIYYLIFSVCESVLGLMILIMIIRFSGNEFYFSINMNKFS